MRRRRRPEEHLNHEAWAIPYGDLVTLLLAFFVVMYAISQVNAGKYRVLSDSLVAAFRGSPQALEPIQVGEQAGGPQSDLRLPSAPPLPLRSDPHRLAPSPPTPPLPSLGADVAPTEALQHIADAVASSLKDLVASHAVVVRRKDHSVEVELQTDILFPSGAAQLMPSAADVIQKLGESLGGFPNPIRVEGYTDDRPISTALFPSNWELSSARAASVVEVLARHGVDPSRLSVLGFGQFRPVASNATPEGRNANRRVLLVILPSSDADPSSAVADTANAAPTPDSPAAPTPVSGAAPAAVRPAPSPSRLQAPTPEDLH